MWTVIIIIVVVIIAWKIISFIFGLLFVGGASAVVGVSNALSEAEDRGVCTTQDAITPWHIGKRVSQKFLSATSFKIVSVDENSVYVEVYDPFNNHIGYLTVNSPKGVKPGIEVGDSYETPKA